MSVDLTLDIKYSLNASDRELKLLRKNKITTSGSFLARKNSDLQKILNSSVDEIIAIKKRIRGYNVPDDYAADDRGKSLADYFDEIAAKAETIPTGVPQLDELLPAGGVFTGEVIEICGRPASGKTMLIFTIILKALGTDEECEIVYFDTKNDFRAIKLKTMMIEQKIPEEVHMSILKRITVKYVRSFDDLNLELSNMKRSELLFKKVKMIVIDSICTLAYFSMGDGTMYNQRMLITTKLVKILSGRNIAFLVSNLALRLHQQEKLLDMLKTEYSQESQESTEEPAPVFNVRPALGNKWTSIAHHKILIDFIDAPHRFEADCKEVERKLSMFSSVATASSLPKNIKITDQGVI